MKLKVKRIQTFTYELDRNYFPSEYTEEQIIKHEETIAKDDPELFFNDRVTEEIIIIEVI